MSKGKDKLKQVPRRIEYQSNNSGGSWWLEDKHWKALEKAGWKVEWFKDSDFHGEHVKNTGRFLGALASRASREGLSMQDAVGEWENITGLASCEAGCPCCGQPHTFTEYDEHGNYVKSGPSTDYSCSW